MSSLILLANAMVLTAAGGPDRIFSDSPAAAIRARMTTGSSVARFDRAEGRTRLAFLAGGLGRPGLRGIGTVPIYEWTSFEGGDGPWERRQAPAEYDREPVPVAKAEAF